MSRDPLLWRLWWRFGFGPLCRVVNLIPVSEWRKAGWLRSIDVWAMDHIGRKSDGN